MTTNPTHMSQNDVRGDKRFIKKAVKKIKIKINNTPKKSESKISVMSVGANQSTQAFTNRTIIESEKFIKFKHLAQSKSPPIIFSAQENGPVSDSDSSTGDFEVREEEGIDLANKVSIQNMFMSNIKEIKDQQAVKKRQIQKRLVSSTDLSLRPNLRAKVKSLLALTSKKFFLQYGILLTIASYQP